MMSSTQQAHTHHESEGDREFSFWGSSNTISSTNDCDQLGGNEATLNNEAEFGETYQRNPFCSTVSYPSRSKDIAEKQRVLLEMMQHMPESSYELSFRDMVIVEKHVVEPEPEPEPNGNETSLDNSLMQSSSNKAQIKRQMKKKKSKNKSNSRGGQIMRAESMDTETFLLKMFFPTSLDWMKKTKVKNGSSKVSPRPSFQESIKQLGKEWRINKFFLAADNRVRGHAEEGINQNKAGHNNRNKNRYVDHSFSFSRGCWPFAPYAKSK